MRSSRWTGACLPMLCKHLDVEHALAALYAPGPGGAAQDNTGAGPGRQGLFLQAIRALLRRRGVQAVIPERAD